MKRKFEKVSYSESQRLAMLENRAAELERRLGGAGPDHTTVADRTGEYPALHYATGQVAAPGFGGADPAARYAAAGNGTSGARTPPGFPGAGGHDGASSSHLVTGNFAVLTGYAGARDDAGMSGLPVGSPAADGYPAAGTFPASSGYVAAGTVPPSGGYAGTGSFPGAGGYPAAGAMPATGGYGGTGAFVAGGYAGADASAGAFPGGAGYPGTGGYDAAGSYPVADAEEADERTEVLINRGRRNATRTRRGCLLAHWRALAVGVGVVAFGATLLAILPQGSANWPASVAEVQAEITTACQNPNVVSEPSQINFACAKDSRQILWVFSLLTSDDNPNFTDSANGRKGLEPISPAQGGDVAWSLNLHHPYNPLSPIDSLEVAARAINDIIGGATVTSASGSPEVQPGLESSAANCARYTGSSALVTRQGFPAVCALPVTTPGGQAALVSDVFQQWMVGTPSQVASEAGVMFENADNPGNAQVQSILNSLPHSGL